MNIKNSLKMLKYKKMDDESKQYLISMFIEKVFISKDKTIKIIFHFVDKSIQLDSSVGVPLEERSVHQKYFFKKLLCIINFD